jgi:putative flippase GtrA
LRHEGGIAVPVVQAANLIPTLALRVLRYGGVGLTISVIYSLAVVGFMQASRPISPTMASVAAFLVTLPMSYMAHSRVSFADRPFDTFQPLRFAATTTASFVVAVGGMFCITDLAGRTYLLGIAWNWMIIPAMNFAIYMCWVFRNPLERGTTI